METDDQSKGWLNMATSLRIGIFLLVILLLWVILYYQLVAPAMKEPTPPPGLALSSNDTIGTSPDETEQISGGQSPQNLADNASNNDSAVTNNPTIDQSNDNSETSGSNTLTKDQPDADHNTIDDTKKPVVLPAPPPTTPYVVKHGDTMQTIAKDWFGSVKKWVLIAQENPLADPMKLKAGQTLRLPPKDARPENIPQKLYAELTSDIKYVISSGDTLSAIARRFYGKPDLYTIIYKANRDVIPNPDNLKPGIEISIPKYQQPAD